MKVRIVAFWVLMRCEVLKEIGREIRGVVVDEYDE
jgi:hypothetical protein